jgi:hypothetical protein
MSRQSWQRTGPSLVKESATGIQLAQSCLVTALEPEGQAPSVARAQRGNLGDRGCNRGRDRSDGRSPPRIRIQTRPLVGLLRPCARLTMSTHQHVPRAPAEFPDDPRIPALAAMREHGVAAVLRAAGVGFAGRELELAQHHPGLRCTFIASTGGERLVVKAYPERTHPAAVAELLEGLKAHGLANGRGPTAPPLVAFHPPLSLLVTRWIEGASARELVARGEGSRAGELAADWLLAVSELELEAGRLFGPERAVRDAGKSAATITGADAELGRQAAAVVEAMDAWWPRDGRVAVSNGSFRPKHVLDLVDGPGVIDWDGFRRAALELDGGMFLAGLAQLVQERPEAAAGADAAAAAFRLRLGGLVQERALGWYEAGALLRLAKYDSDPASPRWRARATTLVGRARALLGAR